MDQREDRLKATGSWNGKDKSQYEHVTYAKGSVYLDGEYTLEQLKALVKSMESWNNLASKAVEVNK